MATIKGQNMRLMVDGKCLAMALTGSIHIASQLEDASTKDSTGDWQEQEVTGLSWDASSDAFVVLTDNGTNGEITTALMSLLINKTAVTLTWDTTAGTNNRIGQNSAIKCSGSAYLTDFKIDSTNRQSVKASCQFTGNGPLTMA